MRLRKRKIKGIPSIQQNIATKDQRLEEAQFLGATYGFNPVIFATLNY
jgi:hypothetical protein